MAMSMIVERRFLYGLALYFRQVELSLHRSHDHEWEELIRLISDASPPREVLDAMLLDYPKHAVPDNSANVLVRRCLCALRIRTRTLFMTSQEIDETNALLGELIRMFDGGYPERERLSRIRLRFSSLSDRLGSRLGSRLELANAPIVHIGQAEHLRTFPLSHFVGREWPKLDVTRR